MESSCLRRGLGFADPLCRWIGTIPLYGIRSTDSLITKSTRVNVGVGGGEEGPC